MPAVMGPTLGRLVHWCEFSPFTRIFGCHSPFGPWIFPVSSGFSLRPVGEVLAFDLGFVLLRVSVPPW
jgi:hypothetical protein